MVKDTGRACGRVIVSFYSRRVLLNQCVNDFGVCWQFLLCGITIGVCFHAWFFRCSFLHLSGHEIFEQCAIISSNKP